MILPLEAPVQEGEWRHSILPHAAPRDDRLKHRDFWLKEGVVVNLPRLLDQHLVRIAECGQCCVV